MLNLRFGATDKTIYNVSSFFDARVKNEWLNDQFVKDMVKDVDNSDIVKDRYIESKVLGAISPRELSTGVKGLILMEYMPENEYYGTACGDNCAGWILKIAERKDIFLAFNHLMRFPQPFRIKGVNSGKILTCMMDLIREENDWVMSLNLPR
jgi:hypothetical protein